MTSVLRTIQLKYQTLSKSEKRVADFLTDHHQHLSNMDIRELANKTSVSVATVTRFSKKIGMSSFVELKIMLRDVVNKTNQQDNSLLDMSHFYHEVVTKTEHLQDLLAYQKIADLINDAQSINLFCIGSSGLSGEEFKLRLRRMGKSVDTFRDSHSMVLRAATLDDKDIVIAISSSGQTIEIIKALTLASDKKLPIILLTNYSETALTTLATHVLYTHDVDRLENNGMLNSQLSIMYVIDNLTLLLMRKTQNSYNYRKTLKMLSQYNNAIISE